MRSAPLKAALILAAATAPVTVSIYDAPAATVYWDLNGTTEGAGTTPSGNFDTTTANWNPLADGTGATQVFVAGASAGTGDVAVFSAGSDATGAYTVTQAGTINLGGLIVEEGEVTIGTAGVLALGTSGNVTVGPGATLVTNASGRISVATGATSVYTLNGGTLRTTNAVSAGSFIDTDAGVVLGAAGGTFDYQVAGVLNIFGPPAVATPTGGVISGNGNLTKTGVGVLAIVGGKATYTGATIIDGGELRVRTANNALPITTDLTINANGILNVNGSSLSQQVGSLTGSGLVGLGNGTFIVSGTTTTTFAGSIRDVANAGAAGTTGVGGKFTKSGTSTLTLTGNSTYTGLTTISNGALVLANTSGLALAGTSGITVSGAGSSVRLGANDQIKDTANITLGSGNLLTNGFSEGSASTAGVGTLTLTGATSIINLGTGASVLAFSDSSAAAWTGTALRIYNWTGTLDLGSGIDQLFVGTTNAGLTAAQLAKITFYSDAGTTLIGGATQLSSGEVVATALVPEPTTLAALAGLSVLGLVRRRKA